MIALFLALMVVTAIRILWKLSREEIFMFTKRVLSIISISLEAMGATAGIMITTSYFSKDAKKFQERIKGRMSFIDYSELLQEIMKFK